MGHISGAQLCDGMWKKSTGAISSSWSTRKKGAVNPQLLQGLPIWHWRCHRACPKQTLIGLKRLWQKWKLTIAPNQKKPVNTTGKPLTLGKSIPILIKQCAQLCDGMWKKSTGAISSSWSTLKKGLSILNCSKDFQFGFGDVTGHALSKRSKGWSGYGRSENWPLLQTKNPVNTCFCRGFQQFVF